MTPRRRKKTRRTANQAHQETEFASALDDLIGVGQQSQEQSEPDPPPKTLSDLPTELLLEIFSYLYLYDVYNVRLVCRHVGRAASGEFVERAKRFVLKMDRSFIEEIEAIRMQALRRLQMRIRRENPDVPRYTLNHRTWRDFVENSYKHDDYHSRGVTEADYIPILHSAAIGHILRKAKLPGDSLLISALADSLCPSPRDRVDLLAAMHLSPLEMARQMDHQRIFLSEYTSYDFVSESEFTTASWSEVAYSLLQSTGLDTAQQVQLAQSLSQINEPDRWYILSRLQDLPNKLASGDLAAFGDVFDRALRVSCGNTLVFIYNAASTIKALYRHGMDVAAMLACHKVDWTSKGAIWIKAFEGDGHKNRSRAMSFFRGLLDLARRTDNTVTAQDFVDFLRGVLADDCRDEFMMVFSGFFFVGLWHDEMQIQATDLIDVLDYEDDKKWRYEYLLTQILHHNKHKVPMERIVAVDRLRPFTDSEVIATGNNLATPSAAFDARLSAFFKGRGELSPRLFGCIMLSRSTHMPQRSTILSGPTCSPASYMLHGRFSWQSPDSIDALDPATIGASLAYGFLERCFSKDVVGRSIDFGHKGYNLIGTNITRLKRCGAALLGRYVGNHWGFTFERGHVDVRILNAITTAVDGAVRVLAEKVCAPDVVRLAAIFLENHEPTNTGVFQPFVFAHVLKCSKALRKLFVTYKDVALFLIWHAFARDDLSVKGSPTPYFSNGFRQTDSPNSIFELETRWNLLDDLLSGKGLDAPISRNHFKKLFDDGELIHRKWLRRFDWRDGWVDLPGIAEEQPSCLFGDGWRCLIPDADDERSDGSDDHSSYDSDQSSYSD